MIAFIKSVLEETYEICLTLFKILIPTIIVIKLLKETGLVELIGKVLEPLMFLAGLPGEMGIVWATTLSTNLYGGVIAMASIGKDLDLTVAQATVMASMMLMAHGFPVELQISKKAGARFRGMFAFRFGSAMIFGVLLNLFYSYFNLLQEPVSILYTPAKVDNTLTGWAYGEFINLGYIVIIVFLLILMMKSLEKSGAIELINKLCKPLLKIMGIGEQAAYVTVVGFTLGLSYGGGLIIKEAKSGKIPHRDVFFSLGFMGICHSMVEDTVLMMAVGGDISGILFLRTIFSVLFVAFLVRITAFVPERFFYRWLFVNQ